MPQRSVRAAAAERNSGMSKIGRTTWLAGGVGLVFSALLTGMLHNTSAAPASTSNSPGSTSGSVQSPGSSSGSVQFPGSSSGSVQSPGSSSGSAQVISGGS